MQRLFIVCAVLLLAAPAGAAVLPTKTTITEVNDASLAVRVGDVFGGRATFDRSDLPTDGFLPLDEAGRDLVLDFEDFVLEARDDADFGDGSPAFFVESGRIVGLDFQAQVAGSFFGPAIFEGGVFDDSVVFLDPTSGATLAAGRFEVVPLPSALPLLATAVAVLAWARRGGREAPLPAKPRPDAERSQKTSILTDATRRSATPQHRAHGA